MVSMAESNYSFQNGLICSEANEEPWCPRVACFARLSTQTVTSVTNIQFKLTKKQQITGQSQDAG